MAIIPKERRRFLRVNFKQPLRYQVLGLGVLKNTITEDISLGGIGFINEEFIPTGTVIKLGFNVFLSYIEVLGKIVWVQLVPYSDRYRFGVEFRNLDLKANKSISDFLELQSIHLKKINQWQR
ncbi:MAG: PilZ domain-containing protein [Candidatus Omnitrophica bacterium]|nr:PilZ domain-containing protein [Candidatus Omnitrophota bacterium]